MSQVGLGRMSCTWQRVAYSPVHVTTIRRRQLQLPLVYARVHQHFGSLWTLQPASSTISPLRVRYCEIIFAPPVIFLCHFRDMFIPLDNTMSMSSQVSKSVARISERVAQFSIRHREVTFDEWSHIHFDTPGAGMHSCVTGTGWVGTVIVGSCAARPYSVSVPRRPS